MLLAVMPVRAETADTAGASLPEATEEADNSEGGTTEASNTSDEAQASKSTASAEDSVSTEETAGGGGTDSQSIISKAENKVKSMLNVASVETATAVASGTWGTCPWTIDSDGVLTIGQGTGADVDKSKYWADQGPWVDYRDQIKSIKTDNIIAPNLCHGLFDRFTNLTSVDLSGMNTSNTSNFGIVFYYDQALTSVDLTHLDLSHATYLHGAFDHCTSLTQVDMAGITLPNAGVNASNLFDGDIRLKQITGIESLNVNGIYNFSRMFNDTESLTSINISSWNMSSATSVATMFGSTSSLSSITLGPKDVLYISDSDNADLPDPAANNVYTGKWTKNDPYNHVDAISASELMKKYTTATAAAGAGEEAAWVWEKNDVNIHYDANGGIGAADSIVTQNGGTLPSVAPPTRTGYTFQGYWEANPNAMPNAGNLTNAAINDDVRNFHSEVGTDSSMPSGQYLAITLNDIYTTALKSFGFYLTGPVQATYPVGTTVTISCYAKASRTIECEGYGFGWEGIPYEYSKPKALTTSWQRLTITGTRDKRPSDIHALVFYYGSGFQKGDVIYVSSPKIELGSTATAWTPTDTSKTEPDQYYDANGTALKAYDHDYDTTMYARWQANTYSVKFDANGGSGSMSDQAMVYDTSSKLTANNFTSTGYTFVGWNTKADGSGTSYTDQQEVKNLASADGAAVTLYAQWKVNQYPVTCESWTIDKDGNKIALIRSDSKNYDYGSSAAGKDFGTKGISLGGNINYLYRGGSSITVSTNNNIVYRYYQVGININIFNVDHIEDQKTGTLKYSIDQGTTWAQTSTNTLSLPLPANSEIWLKDIALVRPYEDLDYVGHSSSYGENDTVLTADVDGIYKLKLGGISEGIDIITKYKTFAIIYSLNGGENASGNPSSYTYATDAIILQAPTRKGYWFSGWTDADGNAVTTIPKGSVGDITLTAKWKKVPVLPSTGGTGTNIIFFVGAAGIILFAALIKHSLSD